MDTKQKFFLENGVYKKQDVAAYINRRKFRSDRIKRGETTEMSVHKTRSMISNLIRLYVAGV